MINYYETVASYNKQAILALNNCQVAVAFNLLDQASSILKRKNIQSSENLQALTFNNFGLFYKQTKHFGESVKYFNKAVFACRSDPVLRVSIYLNLSSLYSGSGNHEKSLIFAKQALSTAKQLKEDPEFSSRLLSIYQVIAQQQENLTQFIDSERHYRKALRLAKQVKNSEVFDQISSKYQLLKSKMSSFFINSNRTQKLIGKRFASFTPKLEENNRKSDIYSVTPYLDQIERSKMKNKSLATRCKSRELNRLSARFKFFSKDQKEFKRLGGLKAKNYWKGKKREKEVKTPEIVPVPFRNKLLLFSVNEI